MGCFILRPFITFQCFFFCFFINILVISSNTSAVIAGHSKEASLPQNLSCFSAVATSESSPLPPPQPQPQPQPPPPPLTDERPLVSPLRPSISVVVGVLASMFSIIFLLLLYAKHCKRGTVVIVHGYSGNPNAHGGRKNSGIDRAVIESLPIFRFASLSGQKDGLECAVCLTQFEPTEVLRLLPKCKHAFHVECVDTWLDAHSTCPLCRYRVDPEDILLVEDPKILSSPASSAPSNANREAGLEPEPRDWVERNPKTRSISGRHSSAGERGTGLLQWITQRPGESEREPGNQNPMASFRRSVDSAPSVKRKSESVALGCFDRPRKDGLLLNEVRTTAGLEPRRVEHRILVSPSGYHKQRWSDVHTSDLLYLRSEMLITDSRRLSLSSSSGSRAGSGPRQNTQLPLHSIKIVQRPQAEHPSDNNGSTSTSSTFLDNGNTLDGSSVINVRSVSEITGLSRFLNRGGGGSGS